MRTENKGGVTNLHPGGSALLVAVVSEDGLQLGPDAQHRSGQHVVSLLPESNLAA